MTRGIGKPNAACASRLSMHEQPGRLRSECRPALSLCLRAAGAHPSRCAGPGASYAKHDTSPPYRLLR